MKIYIVIGLSFALLNGCNPSSKSDQNYSKSYDLLEEVLDECSKLASMGRGEEIADFQRTDPWGTPILVFVAHRSKETILVAVAAGADCLHHTVDDVVDTRKVEPYKKSTEQVEPANP